MPKRFEVRIQLGKASRNVLLDETNIGNLIVSGAYNRLRIVDNHGELEPVFLLKEEMGAEVKAIRENYLNKEGKE